MKTCDLSGAWGIFTSVQNRERTGLPVRAARVGVMDATGSKKPLWREGSTVLITG